MVKSHFLSIITIVSILSGSFGLNLSIAPKAAEAAETNLVGTDWNLEQVSTKKWTNWAYLSVKQKIYAKDKKSRVLRIKTLKTPTKKHATTGGVQLHNLPVKAGQTYKLSFDYKILSGNLQPLLGLNSSTADFGNSRDRLGTTAATSKKWLTYTRTFTVPTNFKKNFTLALIVRKGEIYIDNVKIVKVATPIPVNSNTSSNSGTSNNNTSSMSGGGGGSSTNSNSSSGSSSNNSNSSTPPTPTIPPSSDSGNSSNNSVSTASWTSDADHDGIEDHSDSQITVDGFNTACALPPDLWSKANFTDAEAQIKTVIEKLNQYESAGLDPNNYKSYYQQLCVNNDKDNDGIYRQNAYGIPAEAGLGCRYNDNNDNLANRSANNCSDPMLVKIAYSSSGSVSGGNSNTTPPATQDSTPTSTPDTTPTPTPNPDTTTQPITGNTGGADTYPNEQNINFSAFPTLTISDYNGNSIYIASNGNDNNNGSINSPKATLGGALAVAQNGDKIFFRGGTYNDSGYLNIGKSIYVGNYNNEAVTLNISGSVNRRAIELSGTKILLSGITINTDRPSGIAIYASSNLAMRNLTLNMNSSDYREGIVAYDSNKGLLLDNVNVNNAVMGVSCNSAACTDWKLTDVKIKNSNSGNGSGADCFADENGQNLFLKNVEVTGCSADGIDVKGSNVLIVNAYVHNVARNGIKLWNGGDIINSLVFDTGADTAVYLGDRGYSRLINSTIAYPSRDGRAYILAAGYNEAASNMKIDIINSIIYQSPNDGAMLYMPGINGSTRTLNVKNSIFYFTGGTVELESNTAAVINDPANKNKVNIDPKFVSPSRNGNYQGFYLQSSSPAVNAGTDTIYGFDWNYTNRPSGAFDIGAFER